MSSNRVVVNDSASYTIATKSVEFSQWECYLFGNSPDRNDGILLQPAKGNVPNRFVRWMMKVCLGCTWVKVKREVAIDPNVKITGIIK